MLTIKNIDKIVGKRMVLYNLSLPSQLLDWECEKVIEFPDAVSSLSGTADDSYRFEFKSVSGYDVPLCIYLNRVADLTGMYRFENNLMDVVDIIAVENVTNIKLFEKALCMYSTEVILRWAKDQNMI
jgi:hypothetical protein